MSNSKDEMKAKASLGLIQHHAVKTCGEW